MVLVIRKKYITSFAIIIICALLILPWTTKYDTALSSDSSIQFPIIMYHHISPEQKRFNDYVISVTQFEKDLKYLKEKGYNTITMTQLLNHVNYGEYLPSKPVMITFDDGFESFYAYAFPLLKKYEMSAIVSIVGIYTDRYTEAEDHHVGYSHLSWQEVNALQTSGIVEIQNHTYNMHTDTGRRKGCALKRGETISSYTKVLIEDVGKLQQGIFEHTGWRPNTFTYPFGFTCDESIGILKMLGFEAALTCEEGQNVIEYNNKEWLFKLKRYNRPHGISSQRFFRKVLN